jgi:glutamate formiminotransferase
VIRHSNGGLRFVKALGLLVEGRAQVSINMTDFRSTPLHRVFELIRAEAARYGVLPTESEIVGLVPEDALLDAAEHYLQLNRFKRSQVLERRLSEAEASAQTSATHATSDA